MKDYININGLSNTYGQVFATEKDGKYYLGLDDYSSCSYVEISKNLFKMMKKEFNN